MPGVLIKQRNTRLLTLRVVWRNLLFQDHLVGVHICFSAGVFFVLQTVTRARIYV